MSYSPEHYLANKEQYAAKSKAWREKNKEKARQNRKRHYEENKQKNLEQMAWYSLKRKYGLTQKEYTEMLDKQKGVCAICGGVCTRRLAVDHDHETGKVRGLLCNNCNRGLGHFQDNVGFLDAAIRYLKEGGSCGV